MKKKRGIIAPLFYMINCISNDKRNISLVFFRRRERGCNDGNEDCHAFGSQ